MRKILRSLVFTFVFIINANLATAETLSYIPENPEKALIIIHGYGQSGDKLQWMTNRLKNELKDTAFYYPTAPDRAPHRGYQWFVIPVFGAEMADMKMYERMLNDAVDNVVVLHDLVDEIHNDLQIPYENIDVAGFSQGGLMALLTGLTNPNHIGRVVSLSGVPLLLTEDFGEDMIVSEPDILLIQGDNDQVIPINSIFMTNQTLEGLGFQPQAETIRGMGHEINPQAQQKMIEFLQ